MLNIDTISPRDSTGYIYKSNEDMCRHSNHRKVVAVFFITAKSRNNPMSLPEESIHSTRYTCNGVAFSNKKE